MRLYLQGYMASSSTDRSDRRPIRHDGGQVQKNGRRLKKKKAWFYGGAE